MIIQDHKELKEFLFDYLIHKPVWSYDCETYNEINEDGDYINDYYRDYICGHAIGDDEQSVYVPVRHIYSMGKYANVHGANLIALQIVDFAKKHAGILVNHNIKFDFHRFRTEGLKPSLHDVVDWGRVVDTEGWARAILPIIEPMYRITGKDSKANYQLKYLAKRFLKEETIGEEHLKKCKEEYKKMMGRTPSYAHIDIEDMGVYAGDDPKLAVKLYKYLYSIIKDMPDMIKYLKFESIVLKHIFDIEKQGMPIDLVQLNRIKTGLENKIAEDSVILKETLGDINYSSTKQVSEVLISKGFKLDKTDKGAWSVSKSSIEKIDHPFAQAYISYKSDQHTLNTYIKSMERHDVLHGTLSPLGTGSGRLSSREPNLQCIPRKAGNVRSLVAPPKGYYFFTIDWSSMEVVFSAIRSKDPVLTAEINAGEDLHVNAGATAFQKNKKDVTPAERSVGKTLNFQIQYGAGGEGIHSSLLILIHNHNRQLAKDHGVPYDSSALPELIKKHPDIPFLSEYSVGDCCMFVKSYWSKYRVAKAYKDHLADIVKKRGYIVLGYQPRRNYCRSPHMAYNSDDQGTCGMYMKEKLIKIMDFIKNIGSRARIINIVHDEFMGIAPINEAGIEYAIADLMVNRTSNPQLATSVSASSKSWADKITTCGRYI